MINAMLAGWFVLTLLSVIYVARDAFTRNPELTVMKWGWVLVTLYTGPIGVALYVLSCQEPAPLTHERFVTPLWKQGLGSTIHCLAGDATGIIAAAAITSALGFAMWLDVIAEYAFGFAFGLLVFQALFMRDMVGGSYRAALRATFLPEWLSMNAVMAGMIPVMIILMSRDPSAMEATSPRFWGIMALATLVGGILAYPVNVWLVAQGLKHGMGTVRVFGNAGHDLATERALSPAGAVTGAGHPPREVAGEAQSAHLGPAAGGHEAMAKGVTTAQIVAMTVLTLIALAAGVVLAEVGGGFTTSSDHLDHAASVTSLIESRPEGA